MAANPLPGAPGVGDLVTMLIGKRIKVVKTTALVTAGVRGVATYVDAEGKIIFVALSDMAFLAGVGAALAMIPAPMVNEAIKTGKPSEVLMDNAFEVMNIASSLYNDTEGKGTHVKIKELVIAPPISKELAPRLVKPAGRADFDIELPGYANGKLSFFALAA